MYIHFAFSSINKQQKRNLARFGCVSWTILVVQPYISFCMYHLPKWQMSWWVSMSEFGTQDSVFIIVWSWHLHPPGSSVTRMEINFFYWNKHEWNDSWFHLVVPVPSHLLCFYFVGCVKDLLFITRSKDCCLLLINKTKVK